MADKPAPTLTPLAAQRAALLKDIDDLKAALLKVDEQLIALGAGRYEDESGAHKWCVVAASEGSQGEPSYVLPDDGEPVARQLAGEKFGTLFDRVVSFRPVEGFALIAPTHLTPAKARDLVALCLVPGRVTNGKAAYVKKG